jgi:hypothetical protein
MVNTVLEAELNGGGVHALSIQSKTPSQWEEGGGAKTYVATRSPPCLGGKLHEPTHTTNTKNE